MKIIEKYFPDLTELQISQFTLLEELYKDWNIQINVEWKQIVECLDKCLNDVNRPINLKRKMGNV